MSSAKCGDLDSLYINYPDFVAPAHAMRNQRKQAQAAIVGAGLIEMNVTGAIVGSKQ
jgi:hypothetical protein